MSLNPNSYSQLAQVRKMHHCFDYAHNLKKKKFRFRGSAVMLLLCSSVRHPVPFVQAISERFLSWDFDLTGAEE